MCHGRQLGSEREESRRNLYGSSTAVLLRAMSGKGYCSDNAMVETFFKTIKTELVWCMLCDTRAEAARTIKGYIDRSTTLEHDTQRWISRARSITKRWQ
jgi:hypothetical protein